MLHARFTVPTTDVCNRHNFSFKFKMYIDPEFLTVVMLTVQLFVDVALCRLVLLLLLFLSSWTRDDWVAVTTAWRVYDCGGRVAANTLNKQWRTAEKGRSFSLRLGRRINNCLLQKKNYHVHGTFHGAPDLEYSRVF